MTSNKPITAALTAYRAAALRAARWERARRLTAIAALLAVFVLLKLPILFILAFGSFAIYLFWRFCRKTRKPSLFLTGLRLERCFPNLSGLLSGAVSLETEGLFSGSVELRQLTLDRAQSALETLIPQLDRFERAFAILGRPSDAAALARSRRVERAWNALCALICASLFGVAAIRCRDEQVEIPTVVDAPRIERSKPAEPEVQRLPVHEPESQTYASLGASLDALCATLERLDALAATAIEEQDPESLARLAREIAHYVESSNDGAAARTEQTLKLARNAALVRGSVDERSSGRDAASYLLVFRLDPLSSYWKKSKDSKERLFGEIGKASRASDEKVRGAAQKEASRLLEEFTDRVRSERRALEILALSWKFGARLDAFEAARRALVEEAVENLAARPGVSPFDEEADLRAREGFLERLGSLRAELDELGAFAERNAALLANENNADFVDFVKKTTREAGTFELFFDSNLTGVLPGRIESKRSALENAAANAKEERWGKTLAALTSEFDAVVRAPDDAGPAESEALAVLLAWGASPKGKPASVKIAESGATSAQTSRTEIIRDLGDSLAEDEPAADARVVAECDAAPTSFSNAPVQDSAAPSSKIRADRDRTTGTLFDVGAMPSATSPGGTGELEAPSPVENEEAFVAELPKLTQERLERSKEWTPSPEAQEKTRIFREKLWRALGE